MFEALSAARGAEARREERAAEEVQSASGTGGGTEARAAALAALARASTDAPRGELIGLLEEEAQVLRDLQEANL